MDKMYQWTLSVLRRVLRFEGSYADSRPVQYARYQLYQKRLRPDHQTVPYPSRRDYPESLVDLHIISGPLLRAMTAGALTSTPGLTFTRPQFCSVGLQSSPVKSWLFLALKGGPGLRGLTRDLRMQSGPLLERWKIAVYSRSLSSRARL